jgi:hypothetical protein
MFLPLFLQFRMDVIDIWLIHHCKLITRFGVYSFFFYSAKKKAPTTGADQKNLRQHWWDILEAMRQLHFLAK